MDAHVKLITKRRDKLAKSNDDLEESDEEFQKNINNIEMQHTQNASYSSQTVHNDIQSLTTIKNNTENVEQTAVRLEKILKKGGENQKRMLQWLSVALQKIHKPQGDLREIKGIDTVVYLRL